MKKLTILAIILLTSVYSYSQEEIIPVPDYVNTLYVITPEGLKALEKQEASTKTKLKAATFIPYAGLLAGGTRSSVVLIGTQSSVRFNTSDIRFIYEPSVMVDPEQSIKGGTKYLKQLCRWKQKVSNTMKYLMFIYCTTFFPFYFSFFQ